MNTAATRAAIKRASQQARNAMQMLDRDTVDALQALYTDAADQVRAAILARVDGSDTVPVNQLRALLRQMEDLIDDLAIRRDALMAQGLEEAAALGVRPYTLPGVAATGRAGQAVLSSEAAMRVSEEAAAFVKIFTAADGLTLSGRLWRLNQGAKEALTRAIGQAVVSGWDAQRAAAQFMYSGQTVPADVAARLKGAKAGALERAADLLTGDGGEVWKAERVFRTEINRAHGTAYMQGAEKTPGFGGFRYLLSPQHPKPDVCLRKGTLITTRRGLVPIETVRIGDEALTHLGRWRPVVKLYRSASGQSGLVRLCFQGENSRSRPVVLTPNHPVLTPEGWTPAGDLRTGSTVVYLESEVALPHQPCGAGADRTASPDFGETASAAAERRSDQEQCDVHSLPVRCTSRTCASCWLWPTGLPIFDAAKRLLFCFRPAKPDCLHPSAGQTAIAGIDRNAETCLGAACQSSGYPRPSSACKPCSNTSAPYRSSSPQTTFRMSGKPAAWWRGLVGNTRLSSTRCSAPAPSSAVQGMTSGTLGISPQFGCHGSSTEPHTHDRKTAWWSFVNLVPTAQGWVSAACRSVRRSLVDSCADHIAFTPRHTIVELLKSTGEPVFNIEVEDDHSYVANGLVVHNCDLLAAQNLYGLGTGVYPSASACPWPAHPNTLSFVEIVFADEVSAADRAGKETVTDAMGRMSPEVREGILGVEKAALYDAGQVKPWMIRSPLYAVKQRLARTGGG